MSESICKFIPAKDYSNSIKTINFVYETEFHKFSQPFFYSVFHIHLVTKGSANLKINSSEYNLKTGCIFFAFPASLYEISASDNFEYMYISFMGSEASSLLEKLDINISSPVYCGFNALIDFWTGSITRINQQNITILTESVLLYTLSFFNSSPIQKQTKIHTENLFELIVDYIDNHYRENDISLKKLADTFLYTEKYISHIFKKNMDISFKSYINQLRIQYACKLIENNVTSVSEIASQCGYCDSLYFSKVFKRNIGFTPTEYIKKLL